MNDYMRQVRQVYDAIVRQFHVRPLREQEIFDVVQILWLHTASDISLGTFHTVCESAIVAAREDQDGLRVLKD